MSDRHTADTITDDALDALYEQLDAAEESEAQQQLATAREAFAAATTRAARAEAALDRVRALHPQEGDYCAVCTEDFGRLSAPWPCPTIRALGEQPAPAPATEGPTCRYCGADCSNGRSYDGGNLYTCPNCARDRAAVNAAGGRFDDLSSRLRAAPAPAATDATDIERTPVITTGLVVQPYRDDHNRPRWVFRCWGTDTCDGWLSLDHHSQQSAERARDRHVSEAHTEEQP